ncbi:MAG: 4Fe-4S binding protein [Sedimentisphaerales bacterium]|nr:4Fe-4S binding protein [Sedimentisphaerales bacterium]
MKIAVTSMGPSLDDNVEVRFGRCAYFLIIDTDTMQYEAVENPNIALGGGAGIQSARFMSEKGVTTVLTGNCGPNAFNVFGQAGIQVIVGVSGGVRNAVEQFKTNALSAASGPNVASHFGMNTAAAEPASMPQPMIGPLGQGGGMGGGRGMGRGCGMGRGMGRGGGMGRGMGGGGGMGLGATMSVPANLPPTGAISAFSQNAGGQIPEHELAALKQHAEQLEQQKKQLNKRIAELETSQNLVAAVLTEKCTACGICADVCPTGAIKVNGQAVVQADLCTGCALCVGECPNNAIVLAAQSH